MPNFEQEFEAELLSACLCSEEACDIALQILTPRNFYNPTNAKIFGAIRYLTENGQPVMGGSIYTYLRQTKQEEVGDFNFLDSLREGKSAASVNYWAKEILKRSQKREIRIMLLSGASELNEPTGDAEATVAKIQNQISELYGSFTDQSENVKVIDEVLAEIEGGWHSAFTSGFADLDNLVDFSPPQLILIGAPTRTGKSTLAFQLFLQWREAGIFTAYFSNEMTPKMLLRNRFLSFKTGINYRRIRQNRISDMEKKTLNKLTLDNFPLLEAMYHKEAKYITLFAAKCRQLFRRKQGVVFLDFIQRMSAPHIRESKHQELDYIARQLADLARVLNITIVACSQVNRLSTREKRPPILSDLRESGGLEEAADTVLLLYRPESDGLKSYKFKGTELANLKNITEVNIAKNRHDEEDKILLTHIPDFARFEGCAPERRPF